MQHVEEVVQSDDTHLRWRARIAGREQEWDAEITEQHPDERVAWRSTSGAAHAGAVTFHRIDDTHTKVMLQLDSEPARWFERIGDALGILEREAKADLERFKEYIEERGAASGGWRGEVDNPVPGRLTCRTA